MTLLETPNEGQLAPVSGMGSHRPRVCEVQDPHPLQLEENKVTLGSELPVYYPTHGAALADEQRPVADPGKGQASPGASATGKRGSTSKAGLVIPDSTRHGCSLEEWETGRSEMAHQISRLP